MKRLLVTGARGQVGSELARQAEGRYILQALDSKGLDITDREAVHRAVGEFGPDVIINAAAYTAVDRAESEIALAQAINVEGPRNLADACRNQGARLIHLSTDFVFDGQSSVPYVPDAPTNPLSTYGRTKRDGEVAVEEILPDRSVIVRTAWVYGRQGHNFVKSMIRLLRQRDTVGVVMDQIGCPTSAAGLADGLLALMAEPRFDQQHGIRHHSDSGVASWYDFACAIRNRLTDHRSNCAWGEVRPIYTTDYPTPAVRPKFSLLDCRGPNGLPVDRQHWQRALADTLSNILDDVQIDT